MKTKVFINTRLLYAIISRKLYFLITLTLAISVVHTANAQNPSFYDNAISLTRQPTGGATEDILYAGIKNDAPYSNYTSLGTVSTNPTTPAPNIGTFDVNTPRTSQLTFTGGSIVARPAYDPDISGFVGTIAAARILYRVYLSSATSLPNYSAILLNDAGSFSGSKRLYSNNTSVDLLDNLPGAGSYIVDIQFQIDINNNGKVTTYTDPSSSYQARFTITPPLITPSGGTTTWLSTSSTDWTVASNWTNGVPTATSNAIIPEKTTNSNIAYPILNNPATAYEVKNLTLQGNLNSSRALLNIGTATLKVYGDLDQIAGGLTGSTTGISGSADPSQNSTIIFVGADQIITGRLTVSDIVIAGSGTKSVISSLNPSNILVFKPTSVTDGVIVQSAAKQNGGVQTTYVFDTTYNSLIDLGSAGIISSVPGEWETNVSYIKGVSRSLRNLEINQSESFGNIGIDLTSNHRVTSGVSVFRIVGDALTGPTGSTAVPIKRQYQIVGDDNSNAAAYSNSAVDVVFHYLPSLDELNGIAESNLTMFSTPTGAAPYTPLGGTLDLSAHTVTRLSLPSLNPYTLTLGDKTNPLPVSLVAFTAARNNQNILLSWATASEQNNAGFEVQVSTDGATFRKLAFIASKGANSTQSLNYSYTDTEAGKYGIRYYRLRQLDITGEETFSPVRVVSFDGSANAAALAAYPNPFVDKVGFNLDATTLGANSTAHVQLIDMTGRIVREQTLTVQNASLTLDNLNALRSGLYLVRITLPDGSAKTLRIQKQ